MVQAPAAAVRTYRSTLREARARETRERIVRAATELLAGRGYAATTMRAVATAAGVSVATLELGYGTKARLLKAAIDVAIAGDHEPHGVLERSWAQEAAAAADAEDLLQQVAAVIGPAQARSASLVLAVFEGAPADPELAELADRMIAQREVTAAWIVDRVRRTTALRPGTHRRDAVETVWLLMDPAVFDRLTRHRGWSVSRYQDWFAASVRHLLSPDLPSGSTTRGRTPR